MVRFVHGRGALLLSVMSDETMGDLKRRALSDTALDAGSNPNTISVLNLSANNKDEIALTDSMNRTLSRRLGEQRESAKLLPNQLNALSLEQKIPMRRHIP